MRAQVAGNLKKEKLMEPVHPENPCESRVPEDVGLRGTRNESRLLGEMVHISGRINLVFTATSRPVSGPSYKR